HSPSFLPDQERPDRAVVFLRGRRKRTPKDPQNCKKQKSQTQRGQDFLPMPDEFFGWRLHDNHSSPAMRISPLFLIRCLYSYFGIQDAKLYKNYISFFTVYYIICYDTPVHGITCFPVNLELVY